MSGRGGAGEFITNSKEAIQSRGSAISAEKETDVWKTGTCTSYRAEAQRIARQKVPLMTPGDNCGLLTDSNTC